MITLNYTPIEIELNIEQGNINQNAFYSVGFITENEDAPRTIVVNKLEDLLENGYSRGSNAYNFCKAVLIQGQMNTIIVRSKRENESYFEAYLADDNSDYYYVVLGIKDVSEVLSFNSLLLDSKDLKLQFFSTDEDVSELISGRKIVYYYQPDFIDFPYIAFDSGSGVQTDEEYFLYLNTFEVLNTGNVLVSDPESDYTQSDGSDLTFEQAQGRGIKYPEGSWIGLCGNYFPSQVQWLYKNLKNVDTFQLQEIPDLSTISTLMPYNNEKSTLGSGKTGQGFNIHEVVSLDWVRYAIQKKLWEVFYNNERVLATAAGMLLLENAVRYVLDIAVQQDIFTAYTITGRNLISSINRASFSFEATITQTILEVKKVEGTIYH